LLGWFWEISETMLVVWALVLLAAAVAGHSRLALFRDQCLAILVIAGAAAVSLARSRMGRPSWTASPRRELRRSIQRSAWRSRSA
jgi:hypothetical protein